MYTKICVPVGSHAIILNQTTYLALRYCSLCHYSFRFNCIFYKRNCTPLYSLVFNLYFEVSILTHWQFGYNAFSIIFFRCETAHIIVYCLHSCIYIQVNDILHRYKILILQAFFLKVHQILASSFSCNKANAFFFIRNFSFLLEESRDLSLETGFLNQNIYILGSIDFPS